MGAEPLPDHSTCAADRVPQEAIKAAVLAASAATHDDGHTDCYYAGILLAAWPFLNAAAAPAPVPGDGQDAGTITFYSRGDDFWTVLGYDSVQAWLNDQGEAAIEVVPASERDRWKDEWERTDFLLRDERQLRDQDRAENKRLAGEVERLRTMLGRLLDVALVDGYGETVADEARALLDRSPASDETERSDG